MAVNTMPRKAWSGEAVLASQAGKLVCQAVHQVDEPNGKQERPRNLYQPKSEINGSTNQVGKDRIDC